MHHEDSLKEIKKEWHGSLKSYVIGLITSLILTTLSFLLVLTHALSAIILVYTLIGLAITQAIAQLLLFLHVGQEEKPRWEALTFYFMLLVLFIIAIGSIWIMYDLNNRTMLNMAQEMHQD
jgi:cytochrome o ubiquinol oxidase operon protein cyoD